MPHLEIDLREIGHLTSNGAMSLDTDILDRIASVPTGPAGGIQCHRADVFAQTNLHLSAQAAAKLEARIGDGIPHSTILGDGAEHVESEVRRRRRAMRKDMT